MPLDRDAVAREHHGRGVGGGLQGVDAQIDRGAGLHRLHHRHEVGTECGGELALQEVGQVEPHRLRRRGEIAGEAGALGRGQRRRIEALAGEERVEIGGFGGGMRQHDGAAAVSAAAPAERATPPQAVIDQVAHRGAVLGAGEAAGARPAGQRPLGRLAGDSGVEQLDGGGEAGTGGHGGSCARKSPRWQGGRAADFPHRPDR